MNKRALAIVAKARQVGAERLNCVAIAREFGVHKQTVYNILRDAHAADPRVPLPNGKRPHPRRDAIVTMAKNRHSTREIGATLRISHKTVQGVIASARAAGEEFPPPRRSGKGGNWNRMAVDQDVRALLEKLAAERRMSGSQLLNASLRVLLAEPVVLDNLLLVEEDA